MEFQVHKFRCSECNSFLSVLKKLPGYPSCIFHLYCGEHHNLPPLYFCRKHAATFSNGSNLNRHIRNYLCDADDGDYCLPIIEDVVLEDEESAFPPDVDSDKEIVDPPPPLEPFSDWDSFFDPTRSPSIRDHFITGSGKLLSEHSRKYFANEHSFSGNGITNLVSNAFNYKGNEQPSPLEIYFHLYVTSFLMTLTAKQTDVFSNILSVAVSNGIEIGESGVCEMFSSKVTRLPNCMKDIRDFYTSNQNSIYKCIPSPLAQSSNTGTFAYSSYADCIQHFLGWGSETFNFFDYVSQPGITLPTRFTQLLESCKVASPDFRPIVLLFDEWRDKFEGATTKKNRKNVLANTITLLGPPESSGTDPHYTYTVCLGNGGDCSIAAEEILSKELDYLTSHVTYKYSKEHNAMVPVLFALCSSIQDRVERCSFTCTLSFSSPLTRRWGWISPFEYKGLVSCEDCHSRRIKVICNHVTPSTVVHCEDCADFQFDKVPLHMWNVFPDDYPTKVCECGNCPPMPAGRSVPSTGYPCARETDFDWMKCGILFTIHHRIRSLWSSKESAEYLKLCGSNTKIHSSIETMRTAMIESNQPVGPNTDSRVFLHTLPPALKRNVPVDWYVDATMHLLKGLGEDSMDLMADWTKKYSKHTPVCRLANTWFNSIYALQLSWLRVLPFGGKQGNTTGGWVSENYLDFTGIAPFIYRHCLEQELTPGSMAWRDLTWVMRFLHLQSCVWSRVLVVEEEWQVGGELFVNDINHYIKVFLTEMDNFEASFRGTAKHKWLGKANPVSLLNLPKNFNYFGSLRNVWDGNRENYVTVLKPKMGNVRGESSTYFALKLDQVHKQQGLLGMMSTIEKSNPEILDTFPKTRHWARYTSFKTYRTLNAATEGTVISAVQLACMRTEDDEGNWILHETTEVSTFFICVWGEKGTVDLTEICVEEDDPVFLGSEKVLVGYKTVVLEGTTSTDHDFIQRTLVSGQ